MRLKITDLVVAGHVKSRATIVQKKTGTPVPFELTEATRESVLNSAKLHMPKEGPWLFPSRSHAGRHMTTRQYARLVDRWIAIIGLNPADYGTHSHRRTKVALVYRRTGNIRACQLLLGTQSSKARFATSASMSMTRSACRNKPRSDLFAPAA